jgi:hypothetical protein
MFARKHRSVSYTHSACLSQIILPVYRSRKVICRYLPLRPTLASVVPAALEHIGWLCYCCYYYYYYYYHMIIFADVSRVCVYTGRCEEWGVLAWSFGGSKGARGPPRSENVGLFLASILFYLMPLLICSSVLCTAVSRPRIEITRYFPFPTEAQCRILFCV